MFLSNTKRGMLQRFRRSIIRLSVITSSIHAKLHACRVRSSVVSLTTREQMVIAELLIESFVVVIIFVGSCVGRSTRDPMVAEYALSF